MLNYLIDPLKEIAEYRQILDTVRNTGTQLCITGPSDSQKVHLCHAICSHAARKGIFIAFNEMQARRAYEDFSFFLGEDVLFFPSKEIMLHDVEAKSHEAVFQRITAIDRLLRGDFRMVVTSAEAVCQRLVSPALFKDHGMEFVLGTRMDLDHLAGQLIAMGYDRVNSVEGMGQFAMRGGIVDIYSPAAEHAVRMEFFDDEVDSIRRLDINSQRSVEKVESARIVPAREIIYPPAHREPIAARIRKDLESLKKTPNYSTLHSKVLADLDRLGSQYYFPGIDRYIPYMMDASSSLLEYLPEGTLIFADEKERLEQRLENLLLEHQETCKNLMEKGQLLPGTLDMFLDGDRLGRAFEKKDTIYLDAMASGGIEKYLKYRMISLPAKSMASFQGHLDLLVDDLKSWKNRKSSIIILSGTRSRGERLCETLGAKGLEAVYVHEPSETVRPGQVIVTHGSLSKGFEYPSVGLVVVSDKEVFGRDRKAGKSSAKTRGRKIELFTDLNPGDYVVHQSHGIGQYVAIESLSVEGVKRDYFKIKYQDGDYLYIPTNQLDLIQKYIGSEGKAPKLNRLGGSDWAKIKSRVKESLKELAGELIKLYAQRQALKGFAFSPDTVWQQQMEELFPYEETDDQLKCIEEIKRDMESERVMDRLLCGDVGYGKTEVAIRAVFKAVMDGKQVAYLVPTTVLAQQQYNNFKERLKDFPVSVEVISRFRSPADQRRILREVKAGSVDIIIGTHRLLQKDIQFKDLGLLVVDEEQRFGVGHKEKLKNLRPDVDVLTLTATPIPRTLHMSLVGIRDISVIEDPPEERYPVQTYVMEFNRDVIRDAILREMARGGQVFYLYNRVRSIELKAAEIQAMVPDARVGVAHGQMDEKQLEEIMMGFVGGEYDVLVCTTIIESGLDMPNVNTIIVEDADRMGLAQLYQIKGRVGRSNRLAYAYITYRRDKILSEIAEKRLQAIKEFTELGSGFKIAMRDLEIRGAGNLLGPEQHGHMEAVGYDTYCRLLDEAVRELKGEPAPRDETDISIDINVSAYIDDTYIRVENQKIEMYKKIAAITNEQDAEDIEDELTDRYGDIPQPVRNLISIAYIKVLARDAGFASITEKNGSVIFQIAENRSIDIKIIGALMEKYRRQLLFNAGKTPYLMYKVSDSDKCRMLDNIKIILQYIKSFEH